ncbi:MAG TPA: hypothetical protein PLU53_00495 [Bacteroidia bacterium]|nr:hypothetical protein [Bacteroidia bacterium]
MNTQPDSWSSPADTTKKFLSRQITHRLSRFLDRRKYEAVYEGGLDVFNSSGEVSDVVIYQKENGLLPVVAVEICNKAELSEKTGIARQLMNRFRLKEFFLYTMDEKCWYRQSASSSENTPSCISESLALTFEDTLTLLPVSM